MLKKQVFTQKGIFLFKENPIVLFYQFNNVSIKNWQFLKNEIKKSKKIEILILRNKIADQTLKKIQIKNKLLVNSGVGPVELCSTISLPDKQQQFENGVNWNKQKKLLNFTKEGQLATKSDEWLLQRKVEQVGSGSKTSIARPSKPVDSPKVTSDRTLFDSGPDFTHNSINKSKAEKKRCFLNSLFQGPTFLLACKTRNQLFLIHKLLKNTKSFVFIGGFYKTQKISHQSIERIIQLNDSVKMELIRFLEYKKRGIFLVNSFLLTQCRNLFNFYKISLDTNLPNGVA